MIHNLVVQDAQIKGKKKTHQADVRHMQCHFVQRMFWSISFLTLTSIYSIYSLDFFHIGISFLYITENQFYLFNFSILEQFIIFYCYTSWEKFVSVYFVVSNQWDICVPQHLYFRWYIFALSHYLIHILPISLKFKQLS